MEQKYLKYKNKYLQLKKMIGGNRCGLESCTNDANKMCIQCKSIYYCSVEHQKEHWPEHKKKCIKPVDSFVTDILDPSKYSLERKQTFLLDRLKIKELLKTVQKDADKLFITMCLMVGSFKWVKINPQFYLFWGNSNELLPINFEMCCYDAIIYAAYLAGLAAKINIRNRIPYIKFMNNKTLETQTEIIKQYNINNSNNKVEMMKKTLWNLLGCHNLIEPAREHNDNIVYLYCGVLKEKDSMSIFNPNNVEPTHLLLCRNNIVLELNQPNAMMRYSPVSKYEFSEIKIKMDNYVRNGNGIIVSQPMYVADISGFITLLK